VANDPAGVAAAAATLLAAWIDDALRERNVAHLALTGGSSAVNLYTVLREPAWQTAVPWRQVHLWWGDDRFVPSGEAESNFGTAYREWLERVDVVPAANVHPIPVDTAIGENQGGAWAAAAYRTEILTEVHHPAGGLPAFDILMLGLGPDGHILSCFPDSPAFDDGAPIVLDVPAPTHVEPHLPRVTLNPRLVAAAGHVLVMVAGASKASVVRRILVPAEVDPHELPGRLASDANAVWLLDRASAAQLPRIEAG
jgi:6-phosphogluconolactonase